MVSTTTDRRLGVNAGIAIKVPCRVATTANITLSGEQTIDGVACVTNDRVLVKDQTTGTENGIYVVDTGAWSRSIDFDGTYDCAQGTLIHVVSGTIGANTIYELTTSSPVIGTSSLAFSAVFSTATVSAFMQTVLDDATAADARATLGAGDATKAGIQAQTWTGFTTTGTSTAYVLTPSPAITTLAEWQEFDVEFHTAAGATPTLAISGLTAKSLKYRGQDGSAVAVTSGQVPTGWRSKVVYDGTDYIVREVPPFDKQIQSISASVASNALTISASALALDFRSTTLGSGTVTTVSGTPSNLVISSGSTLGTINAIQSNIAVLAINNAGTIELAAVNLAGGVDLSETGLISTTAEGGAGAADSASTIYSTTARTNVSYRVIGIIRSTQATAGTWATAPSLIQGLGGQALITTTSRNYTDQTASRAASTDYYNNSNEDRVIYINTYVATGAGNQPYVTITQNGAALNFWFPPNGSNGSNYTVGSEVTIPAGAAYKITAGAGTTGFTIASWFEK